MVNLPPAPGQPIRRDRRRMLALVDVVGFVLVCGLITGAAVTAVNSAQVRDPSGYSGLTPAIVALAFGLPIVPIAITSILFGLLGGRNAPLLPGRWAGFGRRVGQLALATTIGYLVVVVLSAMIMMIFGLSGGNPAAAMGGALGIGGFALAASLFVVPIMFGICVGVAALVRLVFGGPLGNAQ